MLRILTEDMILAKVRRMVKEYGTQRAVAKVLGVKEAFLHDVLVQRRSVGRQIPIALGYKRMVVFCKEPDVASEPAESMVADPPVPYESKKH